MAVAAAGSVAGASSQATVVWCRLELGAGYGMETNDAGYDLSVSPPCVCTVARCSSSHLPGRLVRRVAFAFDSLLVSCEVSW